MELLKKTVGGTGGGRDQRQVEFDKSGASKRVEVAGSDILNICLRAGVFDAAICIAVLHHISTVKRRVGCFEELRRIVKVGGTIDVQAWAMEQEKDSKRQVS